MTTFVRIGRNPMTDEILVEGYSFIGGEGDVCSFCNAEAVWQLADGDVLYCRQCRVLEHAEGHAFWFDLDVVKGVEITTDDAGIHADVTGWRLERNHEDRSRAH